MLYSANITPIAKRDGSLVERAAERAGDKLRDLDGRIHDFNSRTRVIATSVIPPMDAPEWVEDRGRLWRSAMEAEPRDEGVAAYEFTVELPRGLSEDQHIVLMEVFCEDELAHRGMICDCALHAGHGQRDKVHAHILIPSRRVNSEGFIAKREREWWDKALLQHLYQQWSAYAHEARKETESGGW